MRYTWAAPVYDLLSAEWPVYRVGRLAGIERLRLRAGDRVLDVGCGTGLNLPLLRAAVGASGRVVGVDASPQMLELASRRASHRGWTNIDLVEADATAMDALEIRRLLGNRGGDRPGSGVAEGADAVLFTYSLSLMRPWQQAWTCALRVARPGARIAVVDLALPGGAATPWRPLARLACALGGSDIAARPWTAAEDALVQVSRATLRGGHIEVRVGTVPSATAPPAPDPSTEPQHRARAPSPRSSP